MSVENVFAPKKRGRGRPKKEPPVTSYTLSEEELRKYNDLQLPVSDVRVRITAPRTKPSQRGK